VAPNVRVDAQAAKGQNVQVAALWQEQQCGPEGQT
jgi:hypothetical protein